MATKIVSVKVIKGSEYVVGSEYNNMKLDKIEDESIEFTNSYYTCFQGISKAGELVFEVINTPVEVRYTKI
jgi:hypothetical protein